MSDEISEIDKHPLDAFIKPLSNVCFVVTVALIATGLGFAFGFKNDDWSWVNRFGAVDIVAGLLLTMSPMFNSGIYLSQSAAGRIASRGSNGKKTVTTAAERKIGNAVAIGVCIAVLGTFLNAFGDVVMKLILGAST
jgi:hypothetical protein